MNSLVCCFFCDGRVALLPTRSLKIHSPGKQDDGLYTCTASNRLGAASVSSWLQITGEEASLDNPICYLSWLLQGEARQNFLCSSKETQESHRRISELE